MKRSCVGACFTGSNPDSLFNRNDEYLAVTDFAGVGRITNFFNHLIRKCGIHHDFDFNFGDKIDDIFGTAVDFLVTLLSPVAFNFGDGHALNPDFLEPPFDVVQFKRFDTRLNFFHWSCSFSYGPTLSYNLW